MRNQQYLGLICLAFVANSISAADWSMYRGNPARTGFVEGQLASEMRIEWLDVSPAPQPAWPRSDRMPFDRASQTIIADGKVFYGSSVDGAVYALDLKLGRELWRVYTEAPVRFAPVFWRDRIIVSSDDGFLYAIRSADGKVLWKRRGGPDHRMILGNQRLISKWPARGGPVLVDDVVYFAAGIWPSDGIFLYALNPQNGDVIWRNDDSGGIYMPQPHGGANAKSGISAQGYLVASGEQLFVPTGRAVPAAFDRKSGRFKYFHLQKYGNNGGAPTMAIGDKFFNSGLSFDAVSGQSVAKLRNGPMAATRDGLALASSKLLQIYQWQDIVKPDRKGKPVKSRGLKEISKVAGLAGGAALIVVGDKVVSGGKDQVDIVDLQKKKVVASLKVKGVAYGLAFSDGNLVVSTDQGNIYCFRPGKPLPSGLEAKRGWSVVVRDPAFRTAAEEIVKQSGLREGYCVDLGCGDGALSLELARITNLRIYAIEDDPKKAEIARRNLKKLGLYGSRVTVHVRDLNNTGYPKYMADLVVSARSVVAEAPVPIEEMRRVQRPFGGAMCTGKPGGIKVAVRGALEGAGSWTHQYANPANTLNSDDRLVNGKLGMLWFRDVDIEVPQRHGRAPAPLFHAGRLLHQGINGIVAVDAYNGRELWRYDVKGLLAAYNGDELMGTAGTGSNFCVAGNSVYVRTGNRCLKLDAASGKLQTEFKTPAAKSGEPGVWGYIACLDGVLYGSIANEQHVVTYRYRDTTGDMSKLLTESRSLFALDATTGKLLWQYQAKHSIRHNAIAIGKGRVFLVDRPLAAFDRLKRPKEKKHPFGQLVSLDAGTGKTKWTSDKQIFGTVLAYSAKHQSVLMSYQPTSFRLDSEIGGRIAAFNAVSGKRLWDIKANYRSRPMINDRTVYAQGGAWDLLTGQPRPFNFKRSYGCGILAGSRNMMLFRSATLGYFDLTSQQETENYGGVRPGCWVNAIPAGGIVLIPDASAGCRCSYLNRSWFALESEK